MKLSLPKPRPRQAKSAGRSVELPPFVTNLVRDMRDRRLILPAIVLAVAIVAVPLVMRSDPAPAPAAVPVAVPEDAAQVVPAVLTEEQVGVRDYRERLDELKSKNPFKQKFQLTPREIDEASQLIEAPSADAGTSVPSIPPSDLAPTGGSGDTIEPVAPTEPAPDTSSSEPTSELLILAPGSTCASASSAR